MIEPTDILKQIYCRTLITFLFPLFGKDVLAIPSPEADGVLIPALTVSMSKLLSWAGLNCEIRGGPGGGWGRPLFFFIWTGVERVAEVVLALSLLGPEDLGGSGGGSGGATVVGALPSKRGMRSGCVFWICLAIASSSCFSKKMVIIENKEEDVEGSICTCLQSGVLRTSVDFKAYFYSTWILPISRMLLCRLTKNISQFVFATFLTTILHEGFSAVIGYMHQQYRLTTATIYSSPSLSFSQSYYTVA